MAGPAASGGRCHRGRCHCEQCLRLGWRTVVSRDEVVEAAYESELPRVLGMLAAIWQLALLIQVLGYLREYREPTVPVLVWLGLVAAAVWLVPRTRAGDLTGREAAFAIAIAVVAVS